MNLIVLEFVGAKSAETRGGSDSISTPGLLCASPYLFSDAIQHKANARWSLRKTAFITKQKHTHSSQTPLTSLSPDTLSVTRYFSELDFMSETQSMRQVEYI